MTLYFLAGLCCGGISGFASRLLSRRFLVSNDAQFMKAFALGMAARLVFTLGLVLFVARRGLLYAAFFGAGMIAVQTLLVAMPQKNH